MSKTTVTQLVQQLEARLRVKLLNRTTRQVKITPDGAAYCERVARLLADLEDADTSLSSASPSPKGRLRVNVPSPLARLILMPALPAFHARSPEIRLDMGVSDRMVDLIGDNVDCVLRGGEVTDPSLVVRRVGDLRSRSGKVAPITMQREDEQIEVQGRCVVAVDDGNAYLAAGVAGMGVLWLPHYMAEAHVAKGELVPLFEDGWRFDSMPMYVALPPNRHVSAKLRAFIDWVVELMVWHAPIAGRLAE